VGVIVIRERLFTEDDAPVIESEINLADCFGFGNGDCGPQFDGIRPPKTALR
jgi:hypothetical protein